MLSTEKGQREHKWQQLLKLVIVVVNNTGFEVLMSLSRISQLSFSCLMPILFSPFFLSKARFYKQKQTNPTSKKLAGQKVTGLPNPAIFSTTFNINAEWHKSSGITAFFK